MATDPVIIAALEQHLAQLDAEKARYRWECDLPDCDGLPHDGADYKHARTKQRLPGSDWFIWLLLLGRGWGKTRTGAEAFLELVTASPVDVNGDPTEWLIAGKTYGDTVKNCLQGPSGLLNTMRRRGITYVWNKNEKLITLDTGQRIHLSHGEDEDLARGKNLAGAWLDELGTFKRIKAAWSEALIPALRAMLPGGRRPRLIVTTTPKATNPDALARIKKLKARADGGDGSVHVTTGSTFENAHNLSDEALDEWRQEYPVGSRLYRQELLGEVCEGVEGAMWQYQAIADHRVDTVPGDLIRKLVTIDPAVTSGPTSDETGIVLLGKAMRDDGGKKRPHFYVLADRSGRHDMNEWPKIAVTLAHENDATILVEVDQGGDMNTKMLRDAARELGVPCPQVKTVRASGKGSKATRATPVVAHYLNGRVHHVGTFEHLEDQQTGWVPEQSPDSPDRVDALVHGIRELAGVGAVAVPVIAAY